MKLTDISNFNQIGDYLPILNAVLLLIFFLWVFCTILHTLKAKIYLDGMKHIV